MQVWAVLKPGYLALLNNPFDAKLLDIIVFDVLPTSNVKGENAVCLAAEIRERNPLQYAFKVCLQSNTAEISLMVLLALLELKLNF